MHFHSVDAGDIFYLKTFMMNLHQINGRLPYIKVCTLVQVLPVTGSFC